MHDEEGSRFAADAVLAGRYVLLRLLGKGGFSEVFQVRGGTRPASLPCPLASPPALEQETHAAEGCTGVLTAGTQLMINLHANAIPERRKHGKQRYQCHGTAMWWALS